MKLYFSKEKFKQNASPNVKSILAAHVNILDGLEVDFTKDEKFGFGTTPVYEKDGEHFKLYPVYKEWCEKETQLNLFD
ncbi:hypothetical protein [Oceanobacillus oncorhynchi]|uniref:hypothetical protein n=1 Tax=Oceanobacillus oncorhynchi TaxID=545501 RepID=UPI0018671D44|nr:hypothetical protein [Oceanobacillus oncorhynchi]